MREQLYRTDASDPREAPLDQLMVYGVFSFELRHAARVFTVYSRAVRSLLRAHLQERDEISRWIVPHRRAIGVTN